MSEKWTRAGALIVSHEEPGSAALERSIYADSERKTFTIDKLIADANYGAAIRAFAEAAEKELQAWHSWWVHVQERLIVRGSETDQAFHAALDLLPAQPVPAPTLAEQGEEIKAFIDVMIASRLASEPKAARLKAMVDAIVAGRKEA